MLFGWTTWSAEKLVFTNRMNERRSSRREKKPEEEGRSRFRTRLRVGSGSKDPAGGEGGLGDLLGAEGGKGGSGLGGLGGLGNGFILALAAAAGVTQVVTSVTRTMSR